MKRNIHKKQYIKPNDILICYNNTKWAHHFSLNKQYKIKYITGSLIIIETDNDDELSFSIYENKNYPLHYYKNYFHILKNIRKNKLNKLYEKLTETTDEND